MQYTSTVTQLRVATRRRWGALWRPTCAWGGDPAAPARPARQGEEVAAATPGRRHLRTRRGRERERDSEEEKAQEAEESGM